MATPILREAGQLEHQAESEESEGRFQQAETLYQRALERRLEAQKVLQLDGPDARIAATLNNLANLQTHRGDCRAAIPLLQKARRIWEDTGNPEHPLFAAILDNLGLALQEADEPEKAEPLHEQARQILEKLYGPGDPRVVETLNNLGGLYKSRGDYGKAEPIFQSALKIWEEAKGPRNPDISDPLGNLADLYQSMGDYQKAEALCQRVLAIRTSVYGAEHVATAVPLRSLAELHQAMGEYERAEQHYLHALKILETALGPEHRAVAPIANGLGTLYASMGDYRKAELYLERASKILERTLGPRSSRGANVLDHLASVHAATGDTEKAVALHKQALRVREEVLGPQHPEVASSLNQLSVLYRRMHDPPRARSFARQALDIVQARLGPRHPAVAASLDNLAIACREMGDGAEAEALHQRALRIEEDLGPRYIGIAVTLHNLADLYEARGDTPAALKLLRRGLLLSERLLHQFLVEPRMTRYLATLRADEDRYYSIAYRHPRDPAALRLALGAALSRKARSADAGAQTMQSILKSLKTPEERQELADHRSDLTRLADLELNGPARYPDYEQRVATLEKRIDGRVHALAGKSSRFRELHAAVDPDVLVREVARALPADGALVEVVAFEPQDPRVGRGRPRAAERRYLALVLLHDETIRAADLGTASGIDAAVGRLLDRLRDPTSDPVPAARELHRMTSVARLKSLLQGRRRLFLSPDGQLQFVPFAALHDGRDYLVESYQITYLTSGRDLLRRHDPAGPTGPTGPTGPAASSGDVTLFADPDFHALPADLAAPPGPTGDESWATGWMAQLAAGRVPPLPATRTEAEAIAALFPGPRTRLFLGDRASDAALRNVAAPRILHVATHGAFNEDIAEPPRETRAVISLAPLRPSTAVEPSSPPVAPNPLSRSALLLAGIEHLGPHPVPLPGGEVRNGVVTALEASGMNLDGTELVVLSACNTGRGEPSRLGQGVYGLRRAFFIAGAETLVTSLWPVASNETRDLMIDYYKKLIAGQGRAEAMRQAALAMRRRRPHPYYWAPFIVLGRDAPLGR